MALKFSVLYMGRMEFPKLYLVDQKDETEMVKSPLVATLIQHPTLGNILYDTGDTEDYQTEHTQQMLDTYPLTEYYTVKDALAARGLTPDDIDMIIISHLHFDHAGGLRYFVGTKAIQNVIVSEADLKEAYFRTMTGNGGAYIKSLFDVEGIQFKPINERTKLADDLELFIQESHTPGVIGLIMNTENHGNIIATSDTLYSHESFERATPPGGGVNKTQEEFFRNLEFIKQLKEEHNATLFYGHDYDQVRNWANQGWID